MADIFQNVHIEAFGQSVEVHLSLAGHPAGSSLGWQFYDPDTNRFIMEGEWLPLPAEASTAALTIPFPPESGAYRVYVSTLDPQSGWAYQRGERFLIIDVTVRDGTATVLHHEFVTKRILRTRSFGRLLPHLLLYPLRSILGNRRLIASMARRDILARYRGSFGDVFWTVLNPLILMATYFFVFGVVLRTRFGPDGSRTGFALYFLAGMLPWLAFTEPAGRAPHVIVEHRSFVKKLIFPLETLPVNQVLAGLITEMFAIVIFLVTLLVMRGHIPLTAAFLPAILIPQILFTLGFCWFLSALGVFFRDLGQIMGFLLTLWFFITPICYPEASLPPSALPFLQTNPIFVLVKAYRACLLEGQVPDFLALAKLLALAALMFLAGHAFFYKLRKSFADVL